MFVHDKVMVLKAIEDRIIQLEKAEKDQRKADNFIKLDYRSLKNVYDKWVGEGIDKATPNAASLWLSVMIATGCRKTAVVFRNITWDKLNKEEQGRLKPPDRWINQIGVLKDKVKRGGQTSVRVVTKPILFGTTATEIKNRTNWLRRNFKKELSDILNDFTQDTEAYEAGDVTLVPDSEEKRISNMFGRRLIQKLEKDFMPLLGETMQEISNKTHILRSVYAVCAYQQFQTSIRTSQARFIAQVLGHDTEHSATAYANMSIRFGLSEGETEVDITKAVDKETYMHLIQTLQTQIDELKNQPKNNQPVVVPRDTHGTRRSTFAARVKEAKADGRTSVVVYSPDNQEIEIDFNNSSVYKSPDRMGRIRAAVRQLKKAGLTPTLYRLSQLGYSRKKPYAADLREAIKLEQN